MNSITVADYDSTWPDTFEKLRDRLWPAIRQHAERVEHVGSTSVPGLAAKPVIDMTIVVADVARMAAVTEGLATVGYVHRGDLGIPGREAFFAPSDLPAHHLYACTEGNLGLRNHVAVRDYLREHPERAKAYGELKKQLAVAFPDDIDGYVDGKTAFLIDILKACGFAGGDMDAIAGVNRK